MEKITEIKEITDYSDWSGMDGFEVVTTKQSIKLLIDNGQSCCERWGYFWCNDSPSDFIGATVRSVSLTDLELNEAKMKENDVASLYEGGIMFVNIDTDRGVLQFVAYNEHNGYYGHEAVVSCTQLKHSEYL